MEFEEKCIAVFEKILKMYQGLHVKYSQNFLMKTETTQLDLTCDFILNCQLKILKSDRVMRVTYVHPSIQTSIHTDILILGYKTTSISSPPAPILTKFDTSLIHLIHSNSDVCAKLQVICTVNTDFTTESSRFYR